jgi:hypothetical protein
MNLPNAQRCERNERNNGDDQLHEKTASNWILCYLVCATDAAGGFVGAILLTDNRARPLNFAFVQPVKPTKMQRILYGSTLEEYIKIDVIAQKLWQGLPNPSDILFVDAPDLVLARRVTRVPTAFIAKAPDSETNSSSLSILRYDIGPHKKDEGLVGEIIGDLEGTCKLLEPFSRIREALKEGLKSGA